MWKLNSLVGRCRDRGIEGLGYREIYEATGVATSTLTSIMNNKTKRIDQDTVDRLLTFFSQKLGEDLTINDLLEWKREKATYN
ncbi:MAG: hypothetical protein KDE20_17640 [Caldilineaceae bacterium]|nr:hypothetical protein [Caldilineaceae bacterium]